MRYTGTDCPRAAARALTERRTARRGHPRRGGRVRGGRAVRARPPRSPPSPSRRWIRPARATSSSPGFVTGTLAGWPLADRLAFAGLTAALSVQEFGGSLSAPGWSEIAAWWRQVQRPRSRSRQRCARYAFLDEVLACCDCPAVAAAPRGPHDRLRPHQTRMHAAPGRGPSLARARPGAGRTRYRSAEKRYGACQWCVVLLEAKVVRQTKSRRRRRDEAGPPGPAHDADTHSQPDSRAGRRAHFTVPAKHPMVTVLGSGDSLLRVIEKAFPAADIHVRGNEISAAGDAAEVALIQRLFDEMMLVLRTGQPMTEDAVERSIAMLRASENGRGDGQRDPGRGAHAEHPVHPRPHDPPQDAQPEAVCRRDRQAHRSSSASAPPAPARPISPWPRPCRPSSPSRSTASS